MKKMLHKILFITIIFLSLCVITTIDVQAANNTTELPKCKDKFTEDEFMSRYGFDADFSGNNIKIKIKPTSVDKKTQKKLRKAVFEIKKINGVATPGTTVVKYKKELILPTKYVKKLNLDEDDTMEIQLESTSDYSDPECKGKIKFKVSVEAGGGAVELPIKYKSHPELQALINAANPKEINCSTTTSEFEKAFCNTASIETKAKASGTNYSNKIVNGSLSDMGSINMKCSLTAINDKKPSDSGYYANTKYFYAENIKTPDKLGIYQYNYAPGDDSSKSENNTQISCKIKCAESVEVKYGPPVATKAGLCFEYSIKVTSRLKCSMIEKPNEPLKPSKYCSPQPMCVHAGGVIYSQAGPSEDFDNCINSCDGGKYTSKCSKKCYNEIYANKNTVNSAFYDEVIVDKIMSDAKQKKVDECKKITKKYKFKTKGYTRGSKNGSYWGCYYWSGESLYWQGIKKKNDTTPGRWYAQRNNGTNNKDYSPYAVKKDGFFRKISGVENGKEKLCGAKCYWSKSTCVKGRYLNPGVAESDYEANIAKYKDALNKCKAAETCSTTTSTFKIEVDTSTGKSKLAEDSISPKENGISFTKNEIVSGKNYLTDASGCYRKSLDRGIYYLSEWQVPSSWIDNKTGALSYVPVDGYIKKDKQFCLPLSQNNVNEKWWNYYYTKTFFEKGTNVSTSSSAFEKECNCKVVKNSIAESEISKWNITGTATDFGYFKWNFNVQCFYATNSNTCIDGKTCCTDENCDNDCSDGTCKGSSAQPRIRTVDLQNLFPASDGSSLESTDKTGRNPGFNWSSYAKNTANDSNYQSNPSKYTQWVQKENYSDKKYNKFQGTYLKNSVINYKSNVIREIIGDKDAHFPNDSALKCNNMVKWDDPSCQTGIN